jgi:hypothetical protein
MPNEHEEPGTTYCEGFRELHGRGVRMMWRW